VRGVEGIKDAVVDIVTMELVVSADGGPIDIEKVIRAIRDAGYDAKPKR
jgi:copper chaperone CopZ